MTVRRRRAVDRTLEPQMIDQRGGLEREDLTHSGGQLLVRDVAGAEGVDHDADRLGDADGVGDLDKRAAGVPSGHDVLRDVAHHVRSGTVHLGRILAREGAAAVAAVTAVGVDDDLAASQARVTHRTADDEATGRVDEVAGVAVEQVRRDRGFNDVLDDAFTQVIARHIVAVLRGDDDAVDARDLAVAVLDGDLGLAIGPEEGERAVAADSAELLAEAVRVVDARGHERVGLVDRIAEHHALIASTLLAVETFAFVDALSDVRRLLLHCDQDGAGVAVEAGAGVRVADVADDLADDGRVVDPGSCGDLASDQHEAGLDRGFARNARVRVTSKVSVEDGVGNVVAELVRMSFGDGLGREQVVLECHVAFIPLM